MAPALPLVERLSDLPLVGLAYLHVEQLLVAARPVGEARPQTRVTLRYVPNRTTTRSLGRLSEIAQVMVRHGFGYFLEAHKLTDLLPGRSAEARLAEAEKSVRLGARPASA